MKGNTQSAHQRPHVGDTGHPATRVGVGRVIPTRHTPGMADSSKSTARSGGRGRPAKQSEETVKKKAATSNKHGGAAVEKIEGKKKGHPRADNQELRNIPATISEKLNHQCPYCEAAFASKTRVEKHKAWNHADRVSQEPTAGNEADNEVQSTPVKGSAKKRAAENSDASPIRSKVKKTRELFQHSQNGEYVTQKAGRKHQQGAASEASPTTPGGSEEGEGGSFPEEDPERTRKETENPEEVHRGTAFHFRNVRHERFDQIRREGKVWARKKGCRKRL
ncbi:Z512B protein, partial [Polyodon spathula]|nr:Z512B protein [Polyodon spathula]